MPPAKKTKSPAEPALAKISGEELEAITGLTDRRIRQISKEGYFAPPIRGQYLHDETLRGLFKYYREGKESHAKSLNDAKLQKLRAEAEMAEIKLQETKHDVIKFDDAQAAFDRMLAKFHQVISQKLEIETPPRLNGKPIAEARREAKLIHDETATIINSHFDQSTSELKQ